jgi:hypothetical protein
MNKQIYPCFELLAEEAASEQLRVAESAAPNQDSST